MNKPDDALFNLGHALAVAAAPSSVKDEVIDNFMANWKKHTAKRSKALSDELELDDAAQMLRDFDAGEAKWINGGCK